jgi:DNA helicase II / ATP-dependent DNA helicase PcrA
MEVTKEELQRIKEEEDVVSEVIESLNHQMAYGTARWRHEEVRARDLTSTMVQTRRESDKQMLASDEAVSHQLRDSKAEELKTIEKLLEKPYFARIVLEEYQNDKPKTIEYKLGIAANSDCRIIDWRKAPIAKLYYEYKEGEDYSEEILGRERDGTIKIRNNVEIKEQKLIRVNCGLGNFENNNSTWSKTSKGGESRKNYSSLPSVTSLITKEQFKAVTEDAESAVLIQGVAGSGKTTVALHRLAWLLHEDNSQLQQEDAVIIVLSPILKRYIECSLPLLNIEVKVCTYSEWANFTLKKIIQGRFYSEELDKNSNEKKLKTPITTPPPGVLRVKRSLAILKGIEEYAQALRIRSINKLETDLNWLNLPKNIQQSFTIQKTRQNPVGIFLEELKRLALSSKNSVHSKDSSLEIEKLIAQIDFQLEILLDLPKNLLNILKAYNAILKLDETKLLDLDLLARTFEYTHKCFSDNTIDPSDEPLLLRLYQVLFGRIFLRSGIQGTWKHIVADEIQDFAACELATLVSSVEELMNLTFVGDTSQQIRDENNFPGWEALRKIWSLGEENARYSTLSVSHRSTLQIMQFAEHLSGEKRSSGGRQGKAPLWYHCRSEEKAISEALGWLQRVSEKYQGSLTAVVCGNHQEAVFVESLLEPTFHSACRLGTADDFNFDAGIVVTDIFQIKGLEFPNLLLWNPSANKFPESLRARNLLYVAATRCEENLCLVSWGTPSPILPHKDSKLVRYVPEEKEEVEEVDEVMKNYFK